MKINNPIITYQDVRNYIDKFQPYLKDGKAYNKIFDDLGLQESEMEYEDFFQSLSISKLNILLDKLKQIK